MGTHLKILSLNIHKGFNWTNKNFILENLRDVIRKENADIVFLQEVVGENIYLSKKSKSWPKESQFEFLADQVWSHFSYGKNAVYPEGHHGNAILSKFPIIYNFNHDISTHFFEQRGLLHCKVKIPETEIIIDLLCTHLNIFLSRKKQISYIQSYFKKHISPNSIAILAGDFNDWDNQAKNLFESQLNLNDTLSSNAKTFPVFYPLLKLDGIYTHNLNAVETSVVSYFPFNNWSDHLAIKAMICI